jgi:hypothetical protein
LQTPALPGAVEDLDASALFQAAGSDGGGGSDPDKTAAEPGKDGSMAGGSEATTGVTDAPVSDYGRGKRLRKLVRLLSSKAALQVVVSFRFKVILLVLAICVIHLAAFSVLVGFLSKQYTYLDEVEAAGDVLDLVHRVSTLSVVLEAAQRGQGFAAGNIPRYAAEMEEAYNRCGRQQKLAASTVCVSIPLTVCCPQHTLPTDPAQNPAAGLTFACVCCCCTAG